MTAQIATGRTTFWSSIEHSVPAADRMTFGEEDFRRMVAIERKRTERSGHPFLLMLVELDKHSGSIKNAKTLDGILFALKSFTRETDVLGWYNERTTAGAIFTDLVSEDRNSVLNTILHKVGDALKNALTFDQLSQITLSFHFFPDDWDQENSGRPNSLALYPDVIGHQSGRRIMLAIKRTTDIAGSTLMLLLCLPLSLIIAVAVKTSSRGPVFFRQQRVGQYGRCFTFLKFRSMRANNDHGVHKDYVTKLIAGKAERLPNSNGDGVYKLANDDRITPLGKILRKTSLDELPQFWNVLCGDMSLVGPRPPIPYELEAYQTWHRRRLLQVKPGITGLWQVNGRSRVKFDEMVRLDLRYATSWSPWLDFKILLRTPGAVIRGAY